MLSSYNLLERDEMVAMQVPSHVDNVVIGFQRPDEPQVTLRSHWDDAFIDAHAKQEGLQMHV